jgi:hypothetical protein
VKAIQSQTERVVAALDGLQRWHWARCAVTTEISQMVGPMPISLLAELDALRRAERGLGLDPRFAIFPSGRTSGDDGDARDAIRREGEET